ncbi:hypothetical protein BGZ88_009879 [Linnemannia elongata]|nr:hypothetical protein BGZ88_009879 [Linnemannia elongata]
MLPQEIQTVVAEFLELHDLTRLVRVNKDWNQSYAAPHYSTSALAAFVNTQGNFYLPLTNQSFRPDHYPRIGFRLLKAFFDNLPSELEYFALGAHTFWSEGTQENGHLKIDIENYAHDEADSLDFERYFGLGAPKQHKHLRILSLRGMEGDQDRVLPEFLRGCPNLEVFDNPTPERITARPITGYKLVQAALEEAVGYHLKDLTVVAGEESEWESDGDIAHTISTALSSITGNSFKEVWNKIDIQRDCSSSMKATAEAIGRTCQRDLVTLRIKNASTMESADVQLILSQASALREFSSTRSPRLVARDMVAKPWACQWLTTLCVQIYGIPRPDLEMDEHGQVLSAVKRKAGGGYFLGRKDIQRQVYQQLGRLVCLEVLDSGLGQLASLKELREVDVRMTWHRLGVRELEWMIRQLPRLNVLKGLNPMADLSSLRGDYVPELGVEMWARSHKPEWLPCGRR